MIMLPTSSTKAQMNYSVYSKSCQKSVKVVGLRQNLKQRTPHPKLKYWALAFHQFWSESSNSLTPTLSERDSYWTRTLLSPNSKSVSFNLHIVGSLQIVADPELKHKSSRNALENQISNYNEFHIPFKF